MKSKTIGVGRRPSSRSLIVGALLLIAAVGMAADWYTAAPPSALADATYVGRAACTTCHAEQHAAYVGSHHDHAMELAEEGAVLGDFNDAVFERLGVTTRFFRRGDEYWVNTEGPDGEFHDYRVKYTFGYTPLQQYMVEFPDGRVQVLRESWDTERGEWFYVPPPDASDMRLAVDDPTHWTGIAQNWNSTCAECHSTNVQKNYDLASNTYKTTFSEIDVSCETCHGPASLHVELASSRSLFWDRRHGYGLARLKSVDSTPQLEACAQCHSRRSIVHPNFRPGTPYADDFEISLLREGLYHADGQILDEVFVFGSFLQSRMHREGVRCSDCHDPHSLELKAPGNALCAQCHVPAKYDTPAHHHHMMATPGASCVECHMPATTYMVVDPRRDHSIRVPRPDLTVAIGTPNACNNCHTKESESATWAAAKVVEWYGTKRPDGEHWGPAIHAGRRGDPAGEELLLDVIRKQTTPAIVRATAIELLSQYPSAQVQEVLQEQTKSSDAIVRQAAAAAIVASTFAQIRDVLEPLLSDPVRTVRIEAVERFLPIGMSALPPDMRIVMQQGLAEYKSRLHASDERAGSHILLAQTAIADRNLPVAIEEFQTAIRLEPYLAEPYDQLSQILSESQGNSDRNSKQIAALRREALTRYERDATLVEGAEALEQRMGILSYQLGDLAGAEQHLEKAGLAAPGNMQYALALAEVQKVQYVQGDDAAFSRAVKTLERLSKLDPQNAEAKTLLRELMALQAERERGK